MPPQYETVGTLRIEKSFSEMPSLSFDAKRHDSSRHGVAVTSPEYAATYKSVRHLEVEDAVRNPLWNVRINPFSLFDH